MKRVLVWVWLLLVIVIITSYFMPSAFAQQKKKEKEIVLTTADIKEDYEVLGLVWVRSGEVNLSNVNEKLKEEAKKIGADNVLMVRYFVYSSYIYAYGTAVKLKEKEEDKTKPY